MDPTMINRALKAKKLDKFFECFPKEERYENIKEFIDREFSGTKEHKIEEHKIEEYKIEGHKIEEYKIEETDVQEEFTISKNGEILICGYPALSGAVLLTQLFIEKLRTYFPEHFLSQTLEWEKKVKQNKEVLDEMIHKLKRSGAYVYPLGEGGLNKAMYQLGKDSGIGFTIFHEDIPVRQESIEVCEFFDLDPWSLFSAGSMLIVSERSRELAEQIKLLEIPVARVGYMTSGKDKFISHKTINSRVNRPAPDGLLKVLQSQLNPINETAEAQEAGGEN